MRKIFELLAGVRKDAWMHFTVSLLMAWAVALVAAMLLPESRSPKMVGTGVAWMITALVGIGKELVDSRREGNRFSAEDLQADALGLFIGGLMFLV